MDPISQKNKIQYEYVLNKLSNNKICTFSFKDVHVIKAQDLFECKLEPYFGQRHIDMIHVDNIANGIINSEGLFHSIILLNIIPRYEIVIIDGLHRYIAISQLSEELRNRVNIQVDVINIKKEDDKLLSVLNKCIHTNKFTITI